MLPLILAFILSVVSGVAQADDSSDYRRRKEQYLRKPLFKTNTSQGVPIIPAGPKHQVTVSTPTLSNDVSAPTLSRENLKSVAAPTPQSRGTNSAPKSQTPAPVQVKRKDSCGWNRWVKKYCYRKSESHEVQLCTDLWGQCLTAPSTKQAAPLSVTLGARGKEQLSLKVRFGVESGCALSERQVWEMDRTLDKRKKLLLSIEPLDRTSSFPPQVLTISPESIQKGEWIEFTFPRGDDYLGIFVCSDGRNSGRCQGKESLNAMDAISKNIRKSTGEYSPPDRVYYFQPVRLQSTGELIVGKFESGEKADPSLNRARLAAQFHERNLQSLGVKGESGALELSLRGPSDSCPRQ